MSYKKLINPKGLQYEEIKKFALSNNIPWYWNYECNETPDYYRHTIVDRPEVNYCSNIVSPPLYDLAKVYFKDLIDVNGLRTNYILRMSLNCVHPQMKVTPTHRDHNFSHGNIIVYLTDSGGDTLIDGERFSPRENDVICFEGIDHKLDISSLKKRRIILIITVDKI